jgi:hypothetical protein
MNTTRKEFGTTIATLARLYKEAERLGDRRRAKVYAMAVDVLLDAWPADPEPAPESMCRVRTAAAYVETEQPTLIGLGLAPKRANRSAA